MRRCFLRTATLATVLLLAASCGQPVSTGDAQQTPTTRAGTTSTAAAPTTSTTIADTTSTTTVEETTSTTAVATTSTTVAGEPVEPAAECMPLIEESILRQQALVDTYAGLSLEDLAAFPNAPALAIPEDGPIQGIFTPTEELSAEQLEYQALTERCYLDLFLAPVLGASQVDIESPAAALAWSADQMPFLYYISYVFASEEGRERFGDQFDAPEPTQAMLPSPEVETCEALEKVVLDAVHSGIATSSWHSREYADDVEEWESAVEARAAGVGCQGPFVARTIAQNAHALPAAAWFEVMNRAFILYDAWTVSWESFRP